MTGSYPLVSIIMPNWNGRDYTLCCLESIASVEYPLNRVEIIIADNGSSDGSIEAIESKFGELSRLGFKRLILVPMGHNAGAPAAYNRCLEEASPESEIILKLDNDTLLERPTLAELVHAFILNPSAGIVGARMVHYENPYKNIHGPGFLHPWTLSPYSGNPDMGCSCHFVNEAGMAIRAQLIKSHALRFAEDYFLYYDDTDFCATVRRLNYIVFYEPRAVIRHVVSASSGHNTVNPRRAYYYLRGKLLFAMRHGTLRQKMGFMLPYLVFGCHASALKAALAGNWGQGTYVVYRACFDVLTGRLGRRW